MRSATGIVVALIAMSCASPRPREHTELVCDNSSSSFCTADVVRSAALRFVRANPPPGSTFEVLLSGCATDDVERAYVIAVPARWGAGVATKKRTWRDEEARRVAEFVLPTRRRCSGIAAAIWRAGKKLGELGGVGHLTVVSDLRETGEGLGVNFERSVPPPAVFLDRLRAAHLILDLSPLHLEVCRVHSARTPDSPRWSAYKTERLKQSWEAAFGAMGHPKVSLNEQCPWEGPSERIFAEGAP